MGEKGGQEGHPSSFVENNHQRNTSSPEKKPSAHLQWREAVAGAASGALSKTVTAPLERLKLILQVRKDVSRHQKHPSMMQTAVMLYRTDGLRGFWRGNLPAVLRVSGTAAINFTCMDYYKTVLVTHNRDYIFHKMLRNNNNPQLERLFTSFASGGLAGATATTLMYPLEFTRTRLAIETHHKGMIDIFQYILRTDGVTGFYQGYGVALVGGIYYRILFLGGYDALKQEILLSKRGNETDASSKTTSLTWTERIMSAQLISLTAGTASYPFDSVRRRMMMQAGVPRAERTYRNSIDCTMQMWKERGIRAFYQGLAPNVMRSISGAFLLVGYDAFRSQL